MLPPALPPHAHYGRPNVHVPGGRVLQSMETVLRGVVSKPEYGYSEAHKHYEDIRLILRKNARNGVGAEALELIVVNASMVTMEEGKKRPRLVGVRIRILPACDALMIFDARSRRCSNLCATFLCT